MIGIVTFSAVHLLCRWAFGWPFDFPASVGIGLAIAFVATLP
jgi:hypothetical protein